jgi:hypothetical protein
MYVLSTGTLMTASPYFSSAADEAGLPGRYLYWYGRSGKRYLFTSTDCAGIGDFVEGVAIAVRGGSVVWAGQGSMLADMPRTAWLRGADLYVHLLAASSEERRATVEDLRPPEHLRLAA